MGVDEIKLGRCIHKKQQDSESELPEISDQEAKALFTQATKKIETVRNISSPILKVITLARCMDDLLGILGATGEISDADVIFNMVFYLVTELKTEDCQYLGARFIEECSYIDNFMHEDQLGMI